MVISIDIYILTFMPDLHGPDSHIVGRINIDRRSRVSISAQIARQLTWLIATGVVKPDSFMPTIANLAQHLGVNVHTVRAAYRQLADDGLVSMRRGSRTLVLGYDRDQAWSRRENRQSSFTIGVLVPSFTDYYAEFLDAISNASEVEGWLPVICQTRHYDPRVVSRDIDQLFSRNVDGIIVIHFDRPDRQTSDIFRSASDLRPFVFVDSTCADSGSRIVVDEAAAGFKAINHLIGHGHRRIGFVDPAAGWGVSRFVEGSSPALAAVGASIEDGLIVAASDWSLEAGAKAATQLLEHAKPPTAIFCAGDVLALGAITAIRELGGRVPEDVAVMGYGEIPFAALAAPSLSTTRLPADDLGYEAVRTLRRAIVTGAAQPPVTFETRLMPRQSCDCSQTSGSPAVR